MRYPWKRGIDLVSWITSAVFGALLVAVQVAMAGLPNIELVTTLILVFACVYGWYTAFSVAVFVSVEGLIFGFGLWWFSYLYLWWIPLIVALLLRRFRNPVPFALAAAVFGFLFGTLSCLPNWILFGPENALAYIVAGIPFDIPHGIGNFVLTLVIFYPARSALEKMKSKIRP